MPARRATDARPPGHGLGVRFALVSLLVLLVVGVGGSLYVRQAIRSEALATAEERVASLARVGLAPLTSAADFERGFDGRLIGRLDELVRDGSLGPDVRRVKVYGPTGDILYSDDHDLIGVSAPSHHLDEALAGEIDSELESSDHAGDLGTVLEVYVPVVGDDDRIVGAFELYLSYGPVSERVAANVREVVTVLGAGLLAIHVALSRLVFAASRRLHRQARTLHHQANHDGLTGLANRQRFLRELDAQRGAAARWAVVALDLDGFKSVNDDAGHATGDRVLREIADRLARLAAPDNVVGRLGGDEFALIVRDVADDEEALALGRRALDTLRRPIEVDGRSFFVDASIGVAPGTDGPDPGMSLRDADVAALHAKGIGKGRVVAFEPWMHDAAAERHQQEAELRRAVQREEFVVHYQPVVDLRTGRPVGVEALARWNHPERGLLPPSTFVPLAERTGAIQRIGWLVLRESTAQLAAWRAAGLDPAATMSVNVSARQLSQPDLVDEVAAALADAGLPGSAVVLELTESSLADLDEETIGRLHRLRRAGVRLAIDDFGTGFSSLSYLQRLPVDVLKVDRSFVSGNGGDWTLAEAIVGIGRSLGLELVAEGVEDRVQADALTALGVEVGQGWLWAPALPADEALAVLLGSPQGSKR